MSWQGSGQHLAPSSPLGGSQGDPALPRGRAERNGKGSCSLLSFLARLYCASEAVVQLSTCDKAGTASPALGAPVVPGEGTELPLGIGLGWAEGRQQVGGKSRVQHPWQPLPEPYHPPAMPWGEGRGSLSCSAWMAWAIAAAWGLLPHGMPVP